MTYYAVDALGDAFAVTRSYLLPFDRSRWLRLALVVLFVGGTSTFSFQSSGTDTTGVPETVPGDVPAADLPEWTLAAVALVVVLVVVLALLFTLVGSVMEFVFVESLRSDAVHLRRYGRRYLGAGLRLFGFRVVLGLLTLAAVAVPVGLALLPFLGGSGPGAGAAVGAALVVVPVVLLVAVVAALVSGFTTMFVVPVMLLEERGVLAGWRRFWPTLRGRWVQYAVYVVAEFVLSIAAGIAVAIVDLLVLVALAIPFGILAGVVLLVGGFGTFSTVEVVALVVIGLVYLVLAIVAVLLVQVPVETYFRFYALLVLGDTDEALDLIPDRRAAVRTETETTA